MCHYHWLEINRSLTMLSNTPQEKNITPEFANLFVSEQQNPYRNCIQGLTNEPITVRALLKRADALLCRESAFAGLDDYSQAAIVERLATNRPRICIIQGSADHPAHLYDHEHALRAAARVWQNGGVPFTFGVPVMCDGTAQSNIGQSYSLASRNHTAAAININFEGHAYHAAYVIAGCDKSPTAILSGLAAADRARRQPERGSAPVWAIFVPAHVMRGGEIPVATRKKLEALQIAARTIGEPLLAQEIEENCEYILQCSSNEAFLGLFNRAVEFGLMTCDQSEALLNELAAAACEEKGGICAFNGSGNSSRTLLSAFGFVPPEAELLMDEAPTQLVANNVDRLFRLINKPEFAVCELLAKNYANAIKIHSATGGSSNLMLHMPAVMRFAGFDVSLSVYEKHKENSPVPDIFAHSLTEKRDTFVFAQQAAQGLHHGITSLYRALHDLKIPLDLTAPTITGQTWRARIEAIDSAVSPKLPQKDSLIRIHPIRDISGTDVFHGNFFSSCVLKIAGMSTELYRRFDERVFVVRYYENEQDCNNELRSNDLLDTLSKMPELDHALLREIQKRNGSATSDDVLTMIREGVISFAFVIGGQGPAAFGMPEMFAPSQSLRHHGVIERSSLLMTDGRYSGVSKGPCIGHMVPEAFEGGGIGTLTHGDLLWVRLSQKRIDLLDKPEFLNGKLEPLAQAPVEERRQLIEARKARMEKRQLQIAACSLLSDVTHAEYGVVPLTVHKRATIPLF